MNKKRSTWIVMYRSPLIRAYHNIHAPKMIRKLYVGARNAASMNE